MAPRPTRPVEKCPCDNKPKVAPRLTPVLQISSDSEADRLWRHALIGTSTCIALLRQYSEVKMPRIPIQQIRELRDLLSEICDEYS